MPALPTRGMGTAPIGNLYAEISDETARAALAAAWRGGIRYFDTAPHYGFGLAERRLGQALQTLDPGARAIISTKVGRLLEPCRPRTLERHGFVNANPFEPVFDYGHDAILRSHEESLVRLQRDRVDILLAHDLGVRTHGKRAEEHLRAFLDTGYRAMADLKASGAIDAIGVGVNEPAICEQLLREIDLDIIFLAGRLTLLDQSALDRVVPLCRRRGVRFIAGAPYNSGILASPTREQQAPRYDYAPPPPALLSRAIEIERVCEGFGVSLSATALQYPLRHAGVACVVAGLGRPDEVRDYFARVDCAIPDALWAALAEARLMRRDARPMDEDMVA